MHVWSASKCLIVAVFVGFWVSAGVVAQSNSTSVEASVAAAPLENTSGYNLPPKNILDVMRAPSPPTTCEPDTGYDAAVSLAGLSRRFPASRHRSCASPACASSQRTTASTTRPAATAITPCADCFDLVAHARPCANTCGAARGRLSGHARTGRPTASASRSRTPRWTPSSCGSATPQTGAVRTGAGRAPESDARRRDAMDAGPEDAARQAGARRHGRAAAGAARAGWPEHPGDRRRKGARAAPTRRATRSTTSTTKISSTTTRRRSSRSSTRQRTDHAASASRAIIDDARSSAGRPAPARRRRSTSRTRTSRRTIASRATSRSGT